MILKNSSINNNSAIIGGFIYYTDFIPDFILKNFYLDLKSNNFSNN